MTDEYLSESGMLAAGHPDPIAGGRSDPQILELRLDHPNDSSWRIPQSTSDGKGAA
jgi:hypothetical protein